MWYRSFNKRHRSVINGLPVGAEIPRKVINELFEEDLKVTVDECKLIYNDFDDLPEEAQHIIANMMFNMGRPRLSRFHKMKQALIIVIGKKHQHK